MAICNTSSPPDWDDVCQGYEDAYTPSSKILYGDAYDQTIHNPQPASYQTSLFILEVELIREFVLHL